MHFTGVLYERRCMRRGRAKYVLSQTLLSLSTKKLAQQPPDATGTEHLVVARSALRRCQRSAATSNAGLELPVRHTPRVVLKLD